MAKLIHILAASVGGGLVLGASIRLGEALGSSARRTEKRRLKAVPPRAVPANDDRLLSERLERLEAAVSHVQAAQANATRGNSARAEAAAKPAPEWQSILADVVAQIDRQQSDVENIRQQVSTSARAMESVLGLADDLRDSLHRQIGEDLDQRLGAVEEKLHLSMKAANKETVNAIVASIETRVAPRISRLESDVAEQTAAVSELRDCSLQSERSILRLLTVLERVASPKARQGEPESTQGSASEQTPKLPTLSVVTGRVQDESGGIGMARRPVSFR